MLLAKWDRLQKWVHIQEREVLAKEATKFFDEEQATILKELMGGRLVFDDKLGERMAALAQGPGVFITAIDKFKGEQNPLWKTPQTREQFHTLLNQIYSLEGAGTTLIDFPKAGMSLETGHLISLFGSLGQASGLKAVILSAVSKVVIAAAARGIQIEVDVPLYLAIAEEHQEKLADSLTELLQNAVKYSDPQKGQKTIRIAWDPKQLGLTVVDNGIGMKEPQRIWEEGYQESPDATADRGGLGLAIVKKDLAEIGWQISVESTPDIGSTFTLTPPAAAEPFDLKLLTPEIINTMPPEEKIRLAKQLFLELKKAALTAINAVERLRENDVEKLRVLKDWLIRGRIREIDSLFPGDPSPPITYLLTSLSSSVQQYPLSVEAAIEYGLIQLQTGEWNWEKAKEYILERKNQEETALVDQHGFKYDKSQREISVDLVHYYLRSRSPLQESWEESRWVLHFPKTCEPPSKTPPHGLKHSPWPPDPANDIALKTILELLGWRMTVEETAENIVVRLDFGENSI